MNTTVVQSRWVSSTDALPARALIAGGILMLVLGVPLAPFQAEDSAAFTLALSLNAVQHVLLMVGVIGLARSGAAGTSRLGRMGVWLTLAGLAVLTAAEFVAMTDPDIAGPFYGLATITMCAGLVMAGVAALRAGIWTGWQRYTVLACGVYIALVLGPAFALPGYGPNFAIGIWGICWLLIGVAMRNVDASDPGRSQV